MRNLKVGKIAGIEVILHGTFPLFVLVLGLFVLAKRGPAEAAMLLLTLMALFVFVLLHELGHSLVARRLGVGVRSITLMPMGGIALTENLPRRPAHEVMIALAGPAVNFILAGLMTLVALTRSMDAPLTSPLTGDFLGYLLMMNLMLGAFNLVPAFPMDGGRVLRALLAMRSPYVEATRHAVTVGRVFAVFFVVVGLFKPELLMLGLIGVFLFIAGGRELRGVRLEQLLHRSPVSEFMDERPWYLADRDTLFGEVCGLLSATPELAYTVVLMDDYRCAVLTRRELLSACLVMPAGLQLCRMVENVEPLLSADVSVAMALGRLRRSRKSAVALTRGGEIVGLVSRSHLEERLAKASSGGFHPGDSSAWESFTR